MIQTTNEFLKDLGKWCRNKIANNQLEDQEYKEGEPDIDSDEQDLEEWRQEQARKDGEESQLNDLLEVK